LQRDKLIRDHFGTVSGSFMRRSATPWMLVASFPGVKTLVITHEIGLFEVDFRSEAVGNY